MDEINLDLLEKRIEALELKVFPAGDPSAIANKNQTITNILTQVQTFVTTALTCRETITSMLQCYGTLNEYLDPAGGADELEVEAKRHYILQLHPEIKDTLQTHTRILQNLLPYVESENISKVVEMTAQLEEASVSHLNLYGEWRDTMYKMVVALQNFTDIMSSIKVLFSQLDNTLTSLEYSLQPKFVTEE
ncbi:unnamed protein product [Diabrotica balteata]|uniref:Dynactin subunit 3 n=1 Tax=Diabrotica balteata TaxID=107213 RepID=A0A9N9XE14_DIABA|nr:unnamed protein product [Diabrotica balteata]